MPVKPTYPGVYIEEIPSGVRTIVGVATSIAAFVDSFQRGPLNEAVQVFNIGEFEAEFGGLHAQSEASYGIQQFFQNGGSEAWIVRVGTTGDANAANNAVASSATLQDAPAGGNDVLLVTAGRRIRGESAENPGRWGDALHIEIDYDTSDPATLFNLTVREIVNQGGRRVVLRTETLRNLTMTGGAPNNAIESVNEGSRLVQLSRQNAWPLNRPAPNGTFGAALPAVPAIPADGSSFTVDAGTGAIGCTLDYGGATPTTYPELRPFIEQAIRAAANAAAVLALAEPARSTVRALLSGATVRLIGRGTAASPHRYLVLAGVGTGFTPAATLTIAGATAASLGLNVTANAQQYPLGGGQDGIVPVSGTTLTGNRNAKTGLFALEDVDLFNILCIPRAADLAPTDMQAVYSAAEAYCEERRAFLIVDIRCGCRPTSTTCRPGSRRTSRCATATRRSTFRARSIPDPLNENRLRSVGAGGTIAGLYARTDASRGVWKAPAGTDARLRNVQSLAYHADRSARTARSIRSASTACAPSRSTAHVCWGARTLDGADQLASRVEVHPGAAPRALPRGEPVPRHQVGGVRAERRAAVGADPAQRRRVHARTCSARARSRARRRATPTSSSATRRRRRRTTSTTGIVNIVVGFAPLKPAEFVIIKIQQIAGQIADLTESDAMAQFTVNAQPLRPVQELQVPGEVGRPLRRRRQQGERAQAHHRGRRAPRGRRPEHRAASRPAAPSTRPITLERGVTHDLEFEQWANKVWNFGVGPRRRGLARRLPQGRHHRRLQRGRPEGAVATSCSAAGCRSTRRCPTSTPTPTRSRSRRSSSRTRAGSATTTSSSRASRASASHLREHGCVGRRHTARWMVER